MLQLRTLGALELLDPAGTAMGGRRMLLAILAWLCRSRGGGTDRDRLAALFWENRETAAARHSLRQALTELRALLPEGVLRIDGERVLLEEGVVGLDLSRFEALIKEEDLGGALALYGGEFLPGLEEVGGEAWRGWLDAERAGAARQLGRGFETAIAQSSRQGEWRQAIALAQRWCDLLPEDDRAEVALIRALLGGNQRTDAQHRLHATLERTRRDGDAPSPELERLGRLLEGPAPATPRARGLLSPDLVGRRREFGALTEAWSEVRAGAGRLILLEGEDGSGKTRMVEEFARMVRGGEERAVIAEGRAFAAEGTTPHSSLTRLVDPLAEAPGIAGADPADLGALGGVSALIQRRFAPLSDSAVPPVGEALPRVLAELGSERPILMILDDADFADPESLSALAALARRLPPRLCLLVTSRMAPHALDDLRRGAAGALVPIRLGALDLTATIQLVASMAPIAPSASRLIAQAAVEDLGGMPGHTRELVAHLAELGAIRPAIDGTWDLSGPLDRPVRLPEGVLEHAQRRLEPLSGEARRVIEFAAASAGRINTPRLEAGTGLSSEAFQESLGALISQRLLRPSPGRQDHLEFPSEATRRAIWESLSSNRRAQIESMLATGSPSSARRRQRGRRMAALAILAAIGAATVTMLWPDSVIEEGATLLLADVRNETGDPGLERALTLIATVELNESSRFRLLPRTRVREALGRMGRPGADSVLNEDLAREVAERENLPVVIAIDAGMVDGTYLLGARLVRPGDGHVLRAMAETTRGGDDLLGGMERLLGQVRRALGEINPREVRGRVGLPRVSTGSLAALRLFANGQIAWNKREYGSAREAWQQAVALDSGFAMAYAALSDEAYRVNNTPAGERLLRQALAHADGLTPREQLALRYSAARRFGTTAQAIDHARDLAARYPERTTWFNFGSQLMQAQQCREAIPAFGQALAEDTLFTNAHINIATCHQFLTQYDSAIVAYERAAKLDSTALRVGNVGEEYGAALIGAGAVRRADEHFHLMTTWGPEWNRGRGYRQLAWRALAEGRFGDAQRAASRAIGHARAAQAPLSVFRDRLILARALAGAGDGIGARRELAAAWRERPDSLLDALTLQWVTPVAIGIGAESLLPELRQLTEQRARRGVEPHELALASIRAAEAMAHGHGDSALALIGAKWPRPPLERWGWLTVRRAQALEATGELEAAQALWSEIAASPWVGNEFQDPSSIADLAVARLAAQRGRPTEAMASVNRFLDRWQSADPASPTLLEAQALKRRLLAESSGKEP